MRGRHRDIAKLNLTLDGAAELILETGYEATSIEAIASPSGVSKVTLYKHFGTKRELYRTRNDEMAVEFAM